MGVVSQAYSCPPNKVVRPVMQTVRHQNCRNSVEDRHGQNLHKAPERALFAYTEFHKDSANMKFCYFDESGTGDEPYAVMAGVIVDGARMRVTKTDWEALLSVLSKKIGKQVKEFHSKDFYGGNGVWKGLDGNLRARVISAVLEWLKERKHKVTFCAVDNLASL